MLKIIYNTETYESFIAIKNYIVLNIFIITSKKYTLKQLIYIFIYVITIVLWTNEYIPFYQSFKNLMTKRLNNYFLNLVNNIMHNEFTFKLMYLKYI